MAKHWNGQPADVLKVSADSIVKSSKMVLVRHREKVPLSDPGSTGHTTRETHRTEELVEIEIDLLRLFAQLGLRAVANKSGRATAQTGAIKVRHVLGKGRRV